jgi:GWxTD domain-containing protein
MEDENYLGQVNITIMFKKGDDVVNFSKVRVNSPAQEEIEKTGSFMDFQRFLLPKGVYDMEIIIADAAEPDKESTHEERIDVGFEENEIGISSIELLHSYEPAPEGTSSKLEKNGYILTPKVINYYGHTDDFIPFYFEIYNSDKVLAKDSALLVYYYIRSFETKHTMNNLARFKKSELKNISTFLTRFDVRDLPSGNYEMCVEVRNKENQIVAQKEVFFYRNNPNVSFDTDDLSAIQIENTFTSKYTSIDSLREYVRMLLPIATKLEKEFFLSQLPTADVDLLQRILYNFWLERNELNPEYEWTVYKEAVEVVNRSFSVVRTKGYETDRGRVYLQYGAPSIIVDRAYDTGGTEGAYNTNGVDYQDGGTVPYQIWHYDNLGTQKNRRFVFANKHIAAQTYELIHSDAIGEIYNSQWQAELSRSTYNSRLNTGEYDKFGGKSGEYYHVPY